MLYEFKNDYTIMLPVHRSNIQLSKNCINNLLQNSDLDIIVIDDNGKDEDYVINERVKYIHNNTEERQPLVKIWNQCIKECPTEYVIIASWRQRPTKEHFSLIFEKINEGFGLVAFDGIHFFCVGKHLLGNVGLFDEGFTRGQFEDSDWFHRMRVNNIGIYTGDMPEERVLNGQYVHSMWLQESYLNEKYYKSKWIEDSSSGILIQMKDELNKKDRELFKNKFKDRKYKEFSESILIPNLDNFYNNLYKTVIKKNENRGI